MLNKLVGGRRGVQGVLNRRISVEVVRMAWAATTDWLRGWIFRSSNLKQKKKSWGENLERPKVGLLFGVVDGFEHIGYELEC